MTKIICILGNFTLFRNVDKILEKYLYGGKSSKISGLIRKGLDDIVLKTLST